MMNKIDLNLIDVLSKITGVAPGLFTETSNSKFPNIKTFYCDTECDEFTVMLSPKGDILQISSDFVSFDKYSIDAIMAAYKRGTVSATDESSEEDDEDGEDGFDGHTMDLGDASKINPVDYYFNFVDDDGQGNVTFAIVSKLFWNTHKVWDDSESPDLEAFLYQHKFMCLAESAFEFNGTKQVARALLLSIGLTENVNL